MPSSPEAAQRFFLTRTLLKEVLPAAVLLHASGDTYLPSIAHSASVQFERPRHQSTKKLTYVVFVYSSPSWLFRILSSTTSLILANHKMLDCPAAARLFMNASHRSTIHKSGRSLLHLNSLEAPPMGFFTLVTRCSSLICLCHVNDSLKRADAS